MEQNNKQTHDFQAMTGYFMNASASCFDSCVKDFSMKELSAPERSCVNACYKKQMIVIGSLQNNLSSASK
jgi:hypothetical protein